MVTDDFVSDPPTDLVNDSPAESDKADHAAPVAPVTDGPRSYDRHRKNRELAGSPARTFTLKEAAMLLRVAPAWFWLHRADPDLPRPLRLGSVDNPRAPLRYLETDLVEYLHKLQNRTNATRAQNHQTWGVRDSATKGLG